VPLVPAILRHLEAYTEVAGEDVREAAQAVARRLLVLLLTGAAAFVAILMGCAWLLALTWDGPWRNWTAAGLALGFAAIAIGLAFAVLRPGERRRIEFFSRTRFELKRDRELIDRAFNGRDRATNGGDHAGA
jgi:uncharacterized membrane protein YqjE